MNFLHFIHFTYSIEYLIIVCVLVTTVLILLSLAMFHARKQKKLNQAHDQTIEAIAGDDVITTQLDLARAYIEMNDIPLAKQILQSIARKGTKEQQQEAQELILSIS